jgi:glycosyltransferase involved in cell wall biosynthesis
MTIGIDISPLKTGHHLQHRVRGSGFYITHLISSLRKYFPNYTYLEYTRQEKVRQIVDISHIPYFEPFFLSLPISSRNKLIVTVHDLTPIKFAKHFPAGIKGKLMWQLQRRLLTRADAIITDSESSKKDLVKYVNLTEKNIHVVYLAAGEEFKTIAISDQERKQLQTKYKLPEKFFLYVGDATWNKNLPFLLDCVEAASVPLVMVGKAIADSIIDHTNIWNKELSEVQKRISKLHSVVAIGFIPTEDLVKIYNVAHAFVMPSRYEGFGLPVLEAMQCGIPVLSSRGGSLPEVVGDAGLLFDPENKSELTSLLKHFWHNPEQHRLLSEKSIQRAKKFSWKATATNTVSVYEKIYQSHS